MLGTSGVIVIRGVRSTTVSGGRRGRVSDSNEVCGDSWYKDDILESKFISAISKLSGVKELLELED